MRHPENGFTLVELAIVMTIIGLLIGGILKGQEMIKMSRVTATVAQVKSYQAALTSFIDTYGAWPGDVVDAQNKIPGCNLGCNSPTTGWGYLGDGVIGYRSWLGAKQIYETTTQGNNVGPSNGYETLNFWTHMLQAGLIGGVTDESLRGAVPFSFGHTHPEARVGGGFQAGTTSGVTLYGMPTGSTPITGGKIILLLMSDPTAPSAHNFDPYGNALTAEVAALIDTKMDDGLPSSGEVRGGGNQGRCFDGNTPAAYRAFDTTPFSCRLIFILNH